MNNEIWKDIIDYEEQYQISNFGNIKSKTRTINCNGYNKIVYDKILKTIKHRDGYLQICLNKNGKKKSFYIHRLVALHFIENINNYEQVNHINKDKENNYYLNLEWVSRRENMCHRFINNNTLTKYRGVSKANKGKPWRANININKKQIFLGQFNTQLEAYNARLTYEKDNNIINKYS